MKFYVVHDAEGNILRTGHCQPHMLAQQAGPGETAIEGHADQRRDCVVDGQIVPADDAVHADYLAAVLHRRKRSTE